MQFSVLCRLSELGTCSQNQLGRSVAMDAATTKGVVGRLSARGFVAAVPDPEDRRRLLLSLTAEGRDALGEALPRAAAITEETLAPLTPAERRTLVRLLRKLQ